MYERMFLGVFIDKKEIHTLIHTHTYTHITDPRRIQLSCMHTRLQFMDHLCALECQHIPSERATSSKYAEANSYCVFGSCVAASTEENAGN